MYKEIKLKRGTGIPASLKEGEPAVDITNGDFYIGIENEQVKKIGGELTYIKEGEGEHSVVINDIDNNHAVGAYSLAGGSNTFVGQKGFLIDKTNSSKTDKKYKLSSIDGLEVNDVVSIKAGVATNKLTVTFLNFGTITEIDTDNKTITVNTYQSFPQNVGYLFVLGKNNYGEVISGDYAHAEGRQSIAIGESSHAEGNTTQAIGESSHAEGVGTEASGIHSHAEGVATSASGDSSHAEGKYNLSAGESSHSEGSYSTAEGSSSHAEGYFTSASGSSSHAEGNTTDAIGDSSHAEGYSTTASGNHSHAEGVNTSTGTRGFLIDKSKSSKENLCYQLSSVEGINNNDVGYIYTKTKIYGPVDILLVGDTEANKNQIFVHSGTYYDFTEDIGYLIIEGKSNVGDRFVGGRNSHAEGNITQAIGENSHAEGNTTRAIGENSHAEGNTTRAIGDNSHAEGNTTDAIGDSSHAEGNTTRAIGIASHAEGYYTIAAADYQHVEGKYNIEDKEGKYLHITGNGFDTGASNAYTLDKHGNAWFSGNVKIGGNSYDNLAKELAVIEDIIGKKGIGNHSEVFNNLDETAGWGDYSHAEGWGTQAIGNNSHSEGYSTDAIGESSHAEGMNTKTGRKAYKIVAIDNTNKKYTLSTVDGLKVNDILNGGKNNPITHNIKIYDNFGKIIEIDTNNKTITVDVMCDDLKANNYIYTKKDTLGDFYVMGTYSHAEGRNGCAYGACSHAEGYNTKAYNTSSHAEGYYTEAQKMYTHSEGYKTIARGEASHVEGYQSIAGRKAYRIASVDSENKKYGLDTVTGISVNDILSGYNETSGIEKNFGKVTAVDITNKTIAVDVMGTVVIGDYLYTDDVTAGDTYILGNKAHAEGNVSYAVGENSHSEGNTTRAIGDSSHAEGNTTDAIGDSSHAEGDGTTALGNYSHAEGNNAQAIGDGFHAEGNMTTASGNASHVEGQTTSAISNYSHSEGNTNVSGSKAFRISTYEYQTDNNRDCLTLDGSQLTNSSWETDDECHIKFKNNYVSKIISIESDIVLYVEHIDLTDEDITYIGNNTDKYSTIRVTGKNDLQGTNIVDFGEGAHAEGSTTYASGTYSHAEGYQTKANGNYSHVEGRESIAEYCGHAEGYGSQALGVTAHAEGYSTAKGNYSHSEGYNTLTAASNAHAEGSNTVASHYSSHAEGSKTEASGEASHAEGNSSIASAKNAHAEGSNTQATGNATHAEGVNCYAWQEGSHAEGYTCKTNAKYSHAEGYSSYTDGQGSHAEGSSYAAGLYSHAEGLVDNHNYGAHGKASHTEGWDSKAKGLASHAEGYSTAIGDYSHAEGYDTIANGGSGTVSPQHVEGKYNIEDIDNKYVHIVGNGNSASARSNAHTLDWDGNAWYQGTVKVGGTSYDDENAKELVTKVNSVDKTTETTISITSLADNSQLVYGSVNSINVGFPEPLSFDYMASISFTTPSTIGETYSTFPSDLYFKGDESEGGIFVPNPSTRYTILFYCDGVRRIGLVSGIEVSTT